MEAILAHQSSVALKQHRTGKHHRFVELRIGVQAGTSAPRLELFRHLVIDEGCGALECHQTLVDIKATSESVPLWELCYKG